MIEQWCIEDSQSQESGNGDIDAIANADKDFVWKQRDPCDEALIKKIWNRLKDRKK